MSMRTTASIQCPGCGCSMDVEVWQSINVTLNREMKQNILDGSVNLFTCSKCGKPIHVEYPFLYHDMEKKCMVHVLASDGEDDARAIEELEEMHEQMQIGDPEYEFRAVSRTQQLAEKIVIWDAGLDDCVMEVVKYFMIVAARKQIDPEDVKEVFFYADSETEPEFLICFKDGKFGHTAFLRDMYDKIKADYAEVIEKHKTHRPQRIDHDWALQVIDDFHRQ